MLVTKNLTALLFSLITILLFSCQDDLFQNNEPELEINQYSNVEKALWVHFNDFEKEAKARGVNIDLNAEGLIASIHEIDDDGVAGVCKYSNHQINQIIIDAEFWNKTGYSSREFVVFHELGHCVLGRGHLESQHSNGTCESIMASGTGTCRFNYTTQNREKYLDELFEFGN